MKTEIISKFNERPKTKTARWAMGLGLGSLLTFPILGIYSSVLRPFIDQTIDGNVSAIVGFSIGVVALALAISAIIEYDTTKLDLSHCSCLLSISSFGHLYSDWYNK